ncbi:unnamed protein product [Vitrella brassicaformis CCMP3155]|uniref:Uncharacterized protein n=2 Tax=Vitrella brassicaformis TaxID=1169539 RepID=A0A0G4EKR1_VITBC|nr:unnamed protein product [Vitrella brassicaformis CCMP3155]|eukprot:CEL97741.1 unnamed protein product [Vitrella brassicaformis CCMP3155]
MSFFRTAIRGLQARVARQVPVAWTKPGQKWTGWNSSGFTNWDNTGRISPWGLHPPSHIGGHSVGGSATLERETWAEWFYRWLDVSGYWSRWNSRKYLLLDMDPNERYKMIMMTEYERKWFMLQIGMGACHLPILFYIWILSIQHMMHKPPIPAKAPQPFVDARKTDYSWHSEAPWFWAYPKHRCRECRWSDWECKKECFEKLKSEGYRIWGFDISRAKHFLVMPEEPKKHRDLKEEDQLSDKYRSRRAMWKPGTICEDWSI